MWKTRDMRTSDRKSFITVRVVRWSMHGNEAFWINYSGLRQSLSRDFLAKLHLLSKLLNGIKLPINLLLISTTTYSALVCYTDMLIVLPHKTVLDNHCFSVAATTTRNALPRLLRTVDRYSTFYNYNRVPSGNTDSYLPPHVVYPQL